MGLSKTYYCKKNGNYYQVLFEDLINQFCYVIVVSKRGDYKEGPYRYDIITFEAEIIRNEYEIKTSHPAFPFRNEEQLKPSDIFKRDERLALIKPIISSVPLCYNSLWVKKKISELIKEHTAEKKPSRYKYLSSLRKYQCGGEKPNALLSNYLMCGGGGKEREPKNNRLGRSSDAPFEMSLSKKNKEVIKEHYLKNCASNHANRISDAYNQFLTKYFSTSGELMERYPTISQYVYWGRKLNNIANLKSAKVGEINYKKDYAPLIGNGRDQNKLFGIGSEAQLDTTKDDTHALSLVLENTYIGRMTFFLLIDTASAMPLGILLIPDEPHYETTCLCLTNAASDKVAFCEKLGIPINPEDWPAHHLPSKILSDLGLLFGKKRSSIVNNLKIEIDNCAPFRPDLKPVVESYIGKILRSIAGILNGHGLVNKRDSPRIATDTKKQAILNYNQILKLMVHEILYFIKHEPIHDYPMSPEMLQIDLLPTPLNLWNYYMENGMCAFIDIPDNLELLLLPQKMCAFSDDGIRFEGDDWICTTHEGKEIYKTLLFGKKVKKLSVAFSSIDTTKVYLFSNGIFYPLSPRLQNVNQQTFYEVRLNKKRLSALKRNSRSAKNSAAIKKVHAQQQIINEAKRKAKQHGDIKTTETVDSKNVDKKHYHETEASGKAPIKLQQEENSIKKHALPDFTEDL
jgi:hypothetical protein